MILICCFAPSGRTQQTADVAYIEMVHVKPGNSEKFETTLKRHWGWHEKQGETWSYLVWTVDTGKNDGAYEIVSFGHTWKEVDESNALVAGTPPPEEDPEPYQQTVQESYYRYRPDLSIGSSVQQPSLVASVTQILLRPEAIQDFEIVLQRIKRSLPNTDGVTALSAQCYELVTGGDKPQFLLIEQHRDWASFNGSSELDALRKGNHGEIPEEIVNRFWNSVRSIYSESWHYRSDLSRLTVSRSSADAIQQSPVPMEEESHHHVLLKNEFIEVIRATLPPGESTLFHIHSHDSAGVELTNDTTTEELLGKPEGSPSTSKLGEVWADSLPDGRAYAHRVHNVGDGPMDLINVEFLKKPEPPSAPAASTSVAENSDARVYKWVLAPGTSSTVHTHQHPYLVVAVTSVRLKMLPARQKSFAEEMKPGDFRWVNGKATHALSNDSAVQGQIVEIELK